MNVAQIIKTWAILLTLCCGQLQASFHNFMQFVEQRKLNHVSTEDLEMLYQQFLQDLTPSDQPFLIALGGSPGAGKTTLRKQLSEQENIHLHDMDEVLVRLPCYQEDCTNHGAKIAFDKWWPTAREVAQLLVQYAIHSKYNILYDRTCGAEGSYDDLKEAKKQGYRLQMIGLFVDSEVAIARVKIREQQEGRAMTESILMEYRARFSALWPYYLALVDEAFLYQTNDAPVLIYSTQQGVIDPVAYDQFLQDGAPFHDFFATKMTKL